MALPLEAWVIGGAVLASAASAAVYYGVLFARVRARRAARRARVLAAGREPADYDLSGSSSLGLGGGSPHLTSK